MNDQNNPNNQENLSTGTTPAPAATNPTPTWPPVADPTNAPTNPTAPDPNSSPWSVNPTPASATSNPSNTFPDPLMSGSNAPSADNSTVPGSNDFNSISPNDISLGSTPPASSPTPAWPATPTTPAAPSGFNEPTNQPIVPGFGDPSTTPPTNQNLMHALYAPSTPQTPSPVNPMTTPPNPTPPAPAPDLGTPLQPPPMPTFQSPTPNPTMPSPNVPTGPINQNPIPMDTGMEVNPGLQNPSAVQMDSAPTDLSHLIGNTDSPPPADIYTPPVATAQNSVVPQAAPTAVPESIDGHGKNNKVLIIVVGIVLLLAVAAASAYFILGIGQTPGTTSVPAVQEQAPLTNPPVASSPEPTAEATSSAGFGAINPTATPSATKAPSAAELLKQRQSAASASTQPIP